MFTPVFSKKSVTRHRQAKAIVFLLSNGEPLEQKYRDHELIGNYAYRRECHIEPNWLLIYKQEHNSIIFERTGKHSDLF